MTVKEFIDMKSTFETFKGVKMIIAGIGIELPSVNLLMDDLNWNSDVLLSFREHFETINEYVKNITNGNIMNKGVNKESILEEISAYKEIPDSYMLNLPDKYVLYILENIDIYNSEACKFIWYDYGYLFCIADYNKMDSKRQKVIQKFIEIKYIDMVALYKICGHKESEAAKLIHSLILLALFAIGTYVLFVTNGHPACLVFAVLSTVLAIICAISSFGDVYTDWELRSTYNRLKSKYDKMIAKV